MNVIHQSGRAPRRTAAVLGLVLICGSAAVSVVAARGQQSARSASPAELFQQAEHQKDAVGNLEAAIELYRRVIAAKPDRALAARAQLQIASCYDKLGKPEASAAYDSVVRDYADQTTYASVAKAWLNAHPAAGLQSKLSVERIWEGPDVSLEGGLSSDGRFLVFVSWSGRDANLAIRDLGTGQNRLLTHDATGDDHVENPVFSRDGKQIAYRFGEKDSTVRLMNADGTRMRILLHDGHKNYLQGWSPDGRSLLATHNNADRTRTMVLMSTSDGSTTQLKSFSSDPELGGFSPDGKLLVYAVDNDPKVGSGGVFVLTADGKQDNRLVKGAEQGPTTFRSPMWSPDGRRIYFISDRSGRPRLWSIEVSVREAVDSPILVEGLEGLDVPGMVPLGFTRDGTLFYGTRTSLTNAYAAAFDASTLTAGKAMPITDQAIGSNGFPSFSPDGKHVAYARLQGTGTGGTLTVRTLETGEERAIAPYRGVYGAQGAQWFPDGRSVLITSGVNGQKKQFRKVAVDSGREEVVFEGPWSIWIGALSPDGTTLFYSISKSKEDGGLHLMKRSLETGAETELYRNNLGTGTGLFGLSVSPDGSKLAFAVNVSQKTGDTRVLYTMPVEGGAPREIHRKGFSESGLSVGPNSALGWSADGRYLVATCHDDVEGDQLCAVGTDGSGLKLLGLRMQDIPTRTLSADGKRIAFTGRTNKEELWVARNVITVSSR